MSLGRRLPIRNRSANDDVPLPHVVERAHRHDGLEVLIERPRFHPNGFNELSLREAAAYIGVDESTLRMWISKRRPHPPFKVRNGHRWFNLDQLQTWGSSEAA